jgi:hypothetical protein
VPQVRQSVPGPKKMGEAQRSLFPASTSRFIADSGRPRDAPQVPSLRVPGSPLELDGVGVQCSAQEIRVGSGRDDNSSWKRYLAFPNKIVIPTEA